MKKYLIALFATLAVSPVTQAAELLVTPSASKGARGAATTAYAMDFVSNGDAVGFQFTFPLPKGVKPEQVNVSACASELPKAYSGQCNVAKGHVIGLFANDSNVPFPAGVLPLGKIVIQGATAKSLGDIRFLVSDVNAKPVQSSVNVVK